MNDSQQSGNKTGRKIRKKNGKTFTDKKEASTFIAEFLKKNSNSRSPLHGLSGEYKGLHISTAFEPPFLHEELIFDGQV